MYMCVFSCTIFLPLECQQKGKLLSLVFCIAFTCTHTSKGKVKIEYYKQKNLWKQV